MKLNYEQSVLDFGAKHLKQFIKPQDYALHAINQAVWRYDAQNGRLLIKVAHSFAGFTEKQV
jgi:hypothetical protein